MPVCRSILLFIVRRSLRLYGKTLANASIQLKVKNPLGNLRLLFLAQDGDLGYTGRCAVPFRGAFCEVETCIICTFGPSTD
jgi:hypothetical protein